MTDVHYNPFDPATRCDPWPVYARLRAESPVHRSPELPLTAVSRYQDVMAVLKNPGASSSTALRDLFNSNSAGGSDEGGLEGETLIGSDPPVHTRLRKIVNRAFLPSRIAALEPRVRQVTDRLISRFERSGTCDLMADLAVPLPVTMIAELLGIGAERRDDFKRWSNDLLVMATGRPSPEQIESIQRSDEELDACIDEIVEARRAHPQNDLISTLVAAEAEDDVMTNEEVGNLIALLLIAGNETTSNLIGNAMLALLEHPEQLAALRGLPALWPGAVEELLRHTSPVQLTLRRATRDVELPGGKIVQNEMVAVLLASANRDERQFPGGEQLDVRRDARGHVAFGYSTHFCVGSNLARLEARVALEALVARLRRIERVEERIDYGASLLVRGPSRLRVRFAT